MVYSRFFKQIKARDGKLYVFVIFDGFDTSALAISLDTNMKTTVIKSTLDKAYMAYPGLRGAIITKLIKDQTFIQ